MLPRLYRIKKEKDFERIFKKGTSFKNNLFVLKIVENGLDKSRFAFVVSQKVSKKATERNKLRRIVSEIVRKKIADIQKGLDFAFIFLPGARNKDFLELETLILNTLYKAKCFKQ